MNNLIHTIIIAEINSNTAIQSLLGFIVMIVGTLVGLIFRKFESVVSRREYEAKMIAVGTEIEHQEEIVKEFKLSTKEAFQAIKDQLKETDVKTTTALEKITDKLEDIRENLPK